MMPFKSSGSLLLIVFAVSTLTAHSQVQNSIRILAVPVGSRYPTQQVAEMPLHVPYPGKIDENRKIFVRVFRGSPEDQIKKLPHDLRVGDCVLYTSSARFPAYFDGNGALRIDEIVDFFNTNVGQTTQVLTLVFEEGGEGISSGPLKLSRSGVKLYFANAMKLTLLASDHERRTWDEEIANWNQQERKRQGAQSGGLIAWVKPLFAWVRPTPVQAAVIPVASTPPPQPATTSRVVGGPCDQVSLLPFVHTATNPDLANAEMLTLGPVAQLVARGCRL